MKRSAHGCRSKADGWTGLRLVVTVRVRVRVRVIPSTLDKKADS